MTLGCMAWHGTLKDFGVLVVTIALAAKGSMGLKPGSPLPSVSLTQPEFWLQPLIATRGHSTPLSQYLAFGWGVCFHAGVTPTVTSTPRPDKIPAQTDPAAMPRFSRCCRWVERLEGSLAGTAMTESRVDISWKCWVPFTGKSGVGLTACWIEGSCGLCEPGADSTHRRRWRR